MLVLSLFPGADLFGMAFEREGFCVVRGPDIMLGGDIKNFHAVPGRFDVVVGGPPCQQFSSAVVGNLDQQENLIPEFERVIFEANPTVWVMENVENAPIPARTNWSAVLDAHAFGANQHRKRRFSSNIDLYAMLAQYTIPEEKREKDPWPPVLASEYKMGAAGGRGAGRKVKRRMTIEEVNLAMGLDRYWMTPGLTVAMSYRVRGNGVEMHMGTAIAKAVKEFLSRVLSVQAPLVQDF